MHIPANDLSESTPVPDTHNTTAHFTQEQRGLGCQVHGHNCYHPLFVNLWSRNENSFIQQLLCVCEGGNYHHMQFSFHEEQAGDQKDSMWAEVCLWRVHWQCEALLSEFILNHQANAVNMQRGMFPGISHPFHILVTPQAVQHTTCSTPQPCLLTVQVLLGATAQLNKYREFIRAWTPTK